MSVSPEKLQHILETKLEIYRDVERRLQSMVDHRLGSEWDLDQIARINERFEQLKNIDEESAGMPENNDRADESQGMAYPYGEIKKTTLNIKRLLNILQTRLEGGRQLVAKNLKEVLKNMEIKGYRRANGGKRSLGCVY